MKTTGETAFAENLKKLKKNSMPEKGFFARCLTFFSRRRQKELTDTIFNLKEELARKDHRIRFLRDKVEAYRDKFNEVSEQNDELLEEYNMREFDILNNKALMYDQLVEPLKNLLQKADTLLYLEKLQRVEEIIDEMRADLKTAEDNFQKIKVHRLYFKKLAALKPSAEIINNFLRNPDNIKDVQAAEDCIKNISETCSSGTVLAQFFKDDYRAFKQSLQTLINIIPGD